MMEIGFIENFLFYGFKLQYYQEMSGLYQYLFLRDTFSLN